MCNNEKKAVDDETMRCKKDNDKMIVTNFLNVISLVMKSSTTIRVLKS